MKPKNSYKSLKSNPFNVYRDPTTGKWVIVKSCKESIKKKVA